MNQTLTFYPVGTGNTALVKLPRTGKKPKLLLFDYNHVKDDGNGQNKTCNLPQDLDDALENAGRDSFDIVCFTHLDKDHCRNAKDYFYFDHIRTYQGSDRPRMLELWVPANVITESQNDLPDSAWQIQKEARERLKNGEGIKVFSRPGKLQSWLEDQGLSLESRKNCIVDAGTWVPGLEMSKDGISVFSHSPFSANGQDRNTGSIVAQLQFQTDASAPVKSALFSGDIDSDVLSEIVSKTKRKKNHRRLDWDLLDAFHHCSYKALNKHDKSGRATQPAPEVKSLLQDYGRPGAIVVSQSEPIPTTSSKEGQNPPHFEAAERYKETLRQHHGKFRVTMEHPKKTAPKPLVIEIDPKRGMSIVSAATTTVASTAANAAPRAG